MGIELHSTGNEVESLKNSPSESLDMHSELLFMKIKLESVSLQQQVMTQMKTKEFPGEQIPFVLTNTHGHVVSFLYQFKTRTVCNSCTYVYFNSPFVPL